MSNSTNSKNSNILRPDEETGQYPGTTPEERFTELRSYFSKPGKLELALQEEYLSLSYGTMEHAMIHDAGLAFEFIISIVFGYGSTKYGSLTQGEAYNFFKKSVVWLFHADIGSYAEVTLIRFLQEDDKARELFVKFLYDYVDMLSPFFFHGREITTNELPTTSRVFKISNILKLIRIIFPIYAHSFWSNLSKEQKFQFSKNLVHLMRKKGSAARYRYIISVLNNEINYSSQLNFKESYIMIENERVDFNSIE